MTDKKRDLVEIFGYAPDDLTREARILWNIGGCPFINKACTKINHDRTITYGTCSVTSAYGDVIVCPNRLYANNYEVLARVSADAFGDAIPFLTYDRFIAQRTAHNDCIVALGKNSGKEVQIGRTLSMDWVLAHVVGAELQEYVGVEVQSIDITGNYRDAWHGYKNFSVGTDRMGLPSSQHGLNWANVHKRLIPQLIRKGIVYARSPLVQKGLYFLLPDIVYQKFEDVIGSDLPVTEELGASTITVYTYALGEKVPPGQHQQLQAVRTVRFSLDEFSRRFISGPNLPSGEDLDATVKRILGVL
jgi:hypothetical protein